MRVLLRFFTSCFVIAAATFGIYTRPAAASTHVPAGTLVGQVWTKPGSPYLVDGDLVIAGTGLRIEAGVQVEFQGNYRFEVTGRLNAAGAATDSIVFMAATAAGWDGISFATALPGSYLRFCRIEGSRNSGIRVDNTLPSISDCWIRKNVGSIGGGVRVSGTTDFALTRCNVTNNTVTNGSGRGGGVHVGSGRATLTDCMISNNSVSSGDISLGGGVSVEGELVLDNCLVASNSISASSGSFGSSTAAGAGVYIHGAGQLRNTIVRGNSGATSSGSFGNSVTRGSGIFLAANTGADIRNCIVVSQAATAGAGSFGNASTDGCGIFSSGPDTAYVANCVIAYNNPSGITRGGGSLRIVNTIVWGNTTTQINGTADVEHSDVQGGYVGAGNIAINPSFAAAPNDVRIVDGSPCVDSGTFYTHDVNLQPDTCCPPSLGTWRNDMGAYGGPGACLWHGIPTGPPGTMGFGGCAPTDVAETGVGVGVRIRLLPNAPNPFNPSTMLRFLMPQPGLVDLGIYTASGELVCSLLRGTRLGAGQHEIRWDGRDGTQHRVGSGVYYARVQCDATAASQRLVLLK